MNAELRALHELSGGAWDLPDVEAQDLRAMCAMIERYRDQAIGATDASLVVLAQRYRTDRLLTLDRRHLGVLRTASRQRFTLLPATA